MTMKILILSFMVFVLATPALAQSTGSTSTQARLSGSDEDFLSEMPMDDFPGADELADIDNDGILDDSDTDVAIPDPFAPETEDKPKVKYVYKGYSTTTLRRSIQDDRIDDGYIQGLMQQKGVQ
jgi:hypothetical protein